MKNRISKYAITEINGKRKVVKLEFAQRMRRAVYGIFETKQAALEAVR